tara:strand:+ start:34751 stop:36235 length:1485 start_codon:yes stop_codon:yes gene_type:complete
MGVIQRQSIKSSIVSYTGVIIGFLSTLFIYPLDWELYGSIQYWLTSATILAPILRQGSTALVSKFYPHFKENSITGFIGMILLLTTLTILAMTILILVIAIILYDTSFFNKLEIQSQNLIYVYLLSIAIIYSSIFQYHSANLRRIVVPDVISKIGLKLINVFIILSVYFNFMDSEWSAPVLVIFYLITTVIMFVYVLTIGDVDIRGFKFKSISKSTKKEIARYWLFGGLNYLGILLAYKIDLFMIGTFVNKVSVGYYSIFLFMSNLMIIPMTSINSISGPIISESFEKKDFKNISEIYKKSSNNILVFGVIIFLLIWVNIYFVTEIMSNGEDLVPFVSIFLFLGLAKILDLMTSINNLIMIYSPWYSYNLLFLSIMSIINFVLNLILLETYGITGAAIATLISVFLFNTIKTVFIYVKLKIQPISINTFKILAVFCGGLIATSYLQGMTLINEFVSIIIYSTLICVTIIPIFYYSNASPELGGILDKLIKKIKK